MAKLRSLGVILIILGVLTNNYAYITDIVDNTHEGLIYLGWHGIIAAGLGLVAVFCGTIALLRAAKENADR